MAGLRIEGNTSGNVAEVTAQNNLKVTLPTNLAESGYAVMVSEIDSGTILGVKNHRKMRVTEDDRVKVGIDTMLAQYNFTAGAQNTGDFKHAFATMTMTQSGGYLNINPALATANGNYAYLQSWRHFTLNGDGALHIEFTGLITAGIAPNQVLEAGLFLGTAGTTPTDGVFFRLSSAGLAGIISFNGVETSTGVMIATIPPNNTAKFEINLNQTHIDFWVDGILAGHMGNPAGQAVPFMSLALPICMMMRNTGVVTGGFTTKIGTIHVTQVDLATTKSWPMQKAMQGDAYQGQEGDAMGSLAIYSNAALAAAAALSNTTAAAGNTGLGGVALVLPTLTAGTDGILFSYQNPVGSVTQPPKTLVVNGIRLDASVQVVLAGGPLTLIMGAAFGHTAVSLATAETGSFITATTKAPRRVPLGIFDFPATAAAGTGAIGIYVQFASPIVVNPGEFFAITMRNVGAVTTSGALAITAMVDHFFE